MVEVKYYLAVQQYKRHITMHQTSQEPMSLDQENITDYIYFKQHTWQNLFLTLYSHILHPLSPPTLNNPRFDELVQQITHMPM